MAGINQCPNCGGNYYNKGGIWVCECCGAPRPELLNNEEQFSLLSAAKELRASNFETAEELYLDFISRYPKNHAGYWGLVLTQYGIRYEDDYNGKRIPTCNATSINSFLEDKNYLKAVSLAPQEVADFYIEQAHIIDENRKEWLNIASQEPPYDIFLSYKDTEDDHNTRTQDSYDAHELYTHLRDKGYRVFFSRESLRDKVSQQYEPYIFNALNTASVMILYGSKPEYFSTNWIKNEWQRYYKKIQLKQKLRDSLVVAFSKMNPADLPRPLNSLQCMDADRKTFYLDLDKHIDTVISSSNQLGTGIERIEIKTGQVAKRAKVANAEQIQIRKLGLGTAAQNVSMDEASKAKLALKYIEQELPNNAAKLVDEILLSNPNNAQALWCNLMLQLGIKKQKDFLDKTVLNKLGDIYVLERIIDNSSTADANNFLELFYSAALIILPAFSDRAYDLVKMLLGYNSDGRASFISDLAPVISKSVNSKFFDLLLSITDAKDIDKHLGLMNNFAEGHLNNGNFQTAGIYYKRMLEIDAGCITAHKGLLSVALEQKRLNVYKTPKLINIVNRVDLVENILMYSTKEDEIALLSTMMNAIVEQMREKDADIAQLCILYERLLKYLPFEMKLDKYLSYLASTLVETGAFKLAERYCLILVSYETERYMAYWLLMRIKLKCKYDANIVSSDTNITELPEYNSAMACAAKIELDSFIDNAIQISRKQQEAISIRAKNRAIENEKEREVLEREEKEKQANLAYKRKKRNKKITKLLIFIMIATTTIILISAYGVKTTSGIKYRSVSGGYMIVGVTSDIKEVNIPACINGKPVIRIKKEAFRDNDVITSVYISSNVTTIGAQAFADCDNLDNVYMASNVKTIEEKAFYECADLTTLVLSNNLTDIGDFAFAGCTKLTGVSIPEKVSNVGEGAFFQCDDDLTICCATDKYISDWHEDWNAKDYRRIGGVIKTTEYTYYSVYYVN